MEVSILHRLVIGISKIIFSKGCPPPFQIMFCFEGRAAGAAFSDRVFTHTLNEVSSYRTASLLTLSMRWVHIGQSLYSYSQRGEFISDIIFTHTLKEVSTYRTESLLTLSMRWVHIGHSLYSHSQWGEFISDLSGIFIFWRVSSFIALSMKRTVSRDFLKKTYFMCRLLAERMWCWL